MAPEDARSRLMSEDARSRMMSEDSITRESSGKTGSQSKLGLSQMGESIFSGRDPESISLSISQRFSKF